VLSGHSDVVPVEGQAWTDSASPRALTFVASLLEDSHQVKVAFGSEAGLYSQELAVPSVICGPGSISQAHKPDEFVARDELAKCDRTLDRLISRLEAGVTLEDAAP
jgi:acetylornithine deacetylase